VFLREHLRATDQLVHLRDQALGFGLQLSINVRRLALAHAKKLSPAV